MKNHNKLLANHMSTFSLMEHKNKLEHLTCEEITEEQIILSECINEELRERGYKE